MQPPPVTSSGAERKRKMKNGWFASRVICGKCNHEWVAVWSGETETEELECPKCGQQGFTGIKPRAIDYGGEIFKLVQRIERDRGRADLHSFTAHVNGGFVHVDARCDGISISFQKRDCCEWESWVGTTIAAANRLEMLGMDLGTVSI
jgi:DNA-directed RNA polymerase subunit RPC12/RpoP